MRSFATWYSMPFWSRMGFGVAAAIGGQTFASRGDGSTRQPTCPFLTLYPVVEVAALFGGVVSGGVAAILSWRFWRTFGYIRRRILRIGSGLGFFLLSVTLLSRITEALHAIWKRLVVPKAQSVKEDELKKFQAARIETMKFASRGLCARNPPAVGRGDVFLSNGGSTTTLAGALQIANVGEVLAKADAELGRAVEVVMRSCPD